MLHKDFDNKIFVKDLQLSRILLENNAHFPWVMLVPRLENVSNILNMSLQDRAVFWSEIEEVAQIMKDYFQPDQINIAMLGNVTPQLHCHIIMRYKSDLAFPRPVWGGEKIPYTQKQVDDIINLCFA
jgi:diadenosine tetraphosphate (Ap4A) HIT family hydrolase